MTLHAIAANPVPEGAVSGELKTADNVRVRFARWSPLAPRRGTVCIFPGRAETIEEYFEVVAELRIRGFAVAALDWRGQGGSQRALRDPRKGHVWSFDEYQKDLEVFIREVVLPDCPPPLFGSGPFHGGRHPAGNVPARRPLVRPAGADLADDRARAGPLAASCAGASCGWPGSQAWAAPMYPAAARSPPRAGRFVGNPSRPIRCVTSARLRSSKSVPELGVGSPTVGWTDAAFRIMRRFADPVYPASLRQPMLIVGAGEDNVVLTPSVARFAHGYAPAHTS